MLKNLKRASAIMLSLAMAVQFGLADTYYANTLSEEPIIEETQEQEPVTVEEGSQQVAVEQTEAPAIDAKEEFVQVPETKSVTLSYVAEDGTILQDATTHEYEMGYSLNSDASVMLNFDGYTLKDVVMNDSQIVAAAQANLNVTSDLTSVKFVYQKVMTESHPEANEAQEENKTEEKTEEDAEANPEAKEELPEYPAFNMSATAGNVTVHVTAAEGVLPSGAQLIVKRVTRKAILNAVEETVTEKDKEVDSAIALDITIVNADGIEIQPNGIVNVSFENVAVGGEEVNVYHVTDDASTVTEVATNTQSFDANHFSIYVITGEKKVELTTFNFVAEGNTVSTQIVKTGDTLITPTAPDIAGKAFVEWQENGSKFDGFGVQTITKTEARTITAKYEDALYVYFYNPEGTQIMRTEKVADHNSHDYSHVSYDVDATHKLVGWAADQNGTTNIAKNITVPEGSTSVNVYAIIKEGYWVTFDSDGGSAIDSQFVFDKISLNDQTTPTKPGYTFIGWYNGTEIVENGSAVTTPMTLKAHWRATKVSYTVIHWWENADDDEYSFQESENKTGLTGTEANAKAKSYEGFTAQPVNKKTIKGDGSTIVSVYYKRNIYKVEFFDVRGRTQYKDLTIEAKYGQDISKQWPTKYESSSWFTRPNGSTSQANIATMPLYGAKFYGPKTGYGTETASYYVQVLPGETGTVKMDGIQYKLDHKDASPGSYYSTTTVTEEDQYPLKGYAFNKGPSTKIGQRYDGAKFYYTRNSYDLKFINNGKQEKTVSKKYEQSISSENYTHGTDSIGLLTVTPKSIIPSDTNGIEVTKPADSKYDGKVHENKPTVKDNKTDKTLVEGTDYTLSYKGDTTNAGTVTVTITGAGNYTGSHNVEYQITKRNVTLTSATASKVYDKTPLTNSNITIGGDGFAKLEGASYNVTGSQTNVGESNNEFTYKLNDDTKASNYNIEVKFGKLYITTQDGQVIVVITGHKKTYDYDGTEKTVSGYDVSITEGSTYAEADFTFNGNAEVKATAANTYPMGLKVSDFTNNNTNYSSVTFVVNDGSLVINPKSIIPDGPNTPDEKKTGIEVTNPEDSIYDGLPHVNPLTVTDTKTGAALVRDTDYTLTYSSDVINVGTVEINVKGIGNYTGEFTKTYKITPKEYTVTTDSAKKVYDGTALTAGGKIEGIVDGEVVVVHTTGSQTEVGSTPNTYKLEWKKASSKNYKLKEDSIGTLTVTEQTIDPGKDPDKPNPNYSGVTINNPSNSVYDGKEHKWSPAVTDKEGNALVEGTDYTVEYSTSDFRNVTGTITVTISGIGNYTGTVTRTYEITPKAYTVTTESAKKVYDGTALTAGGKIEGIVDGETVEFTTTGSRTVEGTSKNTYSLKWNGSAIQTNYKLAKESIGDLTVTPKSIIPDEPNTPDDKKTGITVSNPKDSKYDGQEHREVLTVKDTKTGKDLIANKDYTVVYSDDLVNAGTVTIKVSGLGNYSGSFTKTYKITKRLVTLTSATVSKTYDGQALTNTSITVSGDGFVEGEGASYEVTGTQTKVGNSANAFEYKLNENTLASNYDITKVVGTLTITAAPAPVTPPTSPTPVSPPPVTPRYIQQVVPALTPQEEVKKEKTPKAEPKEEKVEKEKTPKARPEKFWALINLICAIVTVLFGLLLLISKRHKKKDGEEEDETKDQTTTNEDEEKEQEKKRGAVTRVLAVLIAILSVVFFLVTEDLSLRWTWTDQWTIWMVVIGLVQIVVFFVGRKWKNVDDDEDEEAQQA